MTAPMPHSERGHSSQAPDDGRGRIGLLYRSIRMPVTSVLCAGTETTTFTACHEGTRRVAVCVLLRTELSFAGEIARSPTGHAPGLLSFPRRR